MSDAVDRRRFLQIAGMSIGVGALYHVAPLLGKGRAGEEGVGMDLLRQLGRKNGEAMTPFSFVQLSDTHVGFSGPPNPLGTRAFERAVEIINGLPAQPDLILFTGDLTHDTEMPGEHAGRMKLFQDISAKLKVPKIYCVPGEHDAGLDGGQLFRDVFGPTNYAFDHRGVHFIALDNVSRAKPEVGAEQIAWLQKDLARFPKTAPIVVFTHRPLFDLKPEWEWFTRDGDEVLNVLAPYQNVTVLYGHIHRHDEHEINQAKHFAARSLSWAFPDPAVAAEKAPVPFNKDRPFQNLGIREIAGRPGKAPEPFSLGIDDVELSMREFSGTEGFNQFLKVVKV